MKTKDQDSEKIKVNNLNMIEQFIENYWINQDVQTSKGFT